MIAKLHFPVLISRYKYPENGNQKRSKSTEIIEKRISTRRLHVK